MSALFFNIAETAASNIIQLIAGCLLAVLVYIVFRGRAAASESKTGHKILTAAFFSLCGTILPLGIYGIIPLISALLAAGFGYYSAGAFLVSNVMFNMLKPYSDPGFIWKTGYKQVAFAFIAGLVAGMLLLMAKNLKHRIFNQKNMPVLKENSSKIRMVLMMIDDSFRKLGLFLFVGVVADIFFQRYMLSNIVNAFYLNTTTASIPTFFGSHDVSNPFFLLTFSIVYMLMNMVNLSALYAILKFRGLAVYFGYYMLLAAILAVSAFI